MDRRILNVTTYFNQNLLDAFNNRLTGHACPDIGRASPGQMGPCAMILMSRMMMMMKMMMMMMSDRMA